MNYLDDKLGDLVYSPHLIIKWGEVKVTQSCLTLCNPMDYTVHGILQASIQELVAFPSPGDLPNPGIEPRDRTQVSLIAGRLFTHWATREAREYWSR